MIQIYHWVKLFLLTRWIVLRSSCCRCVPRKVQGARRHTHRLTCGSSSPPTIRNSESIPHDTVSPSHSRVQSGYGLSQWEKALHSNAFSHWPSPYPEWSMYRLKFWLNDDTIMTHRQTSNISCTKSQNVTPSHLVLLLSLHSLLTPGVKLSSCSWSSADKWCSNYIWVINNFLLLRCILYQRFESNSVWKWVTSVQVTTMAYVSQSFLFSPLFSVPELTFGAARGLSNRHLEVLKEELDAMARKCRGEVRIGWIK